MKVKKLAAIGEIVGSVAIVLTLGYLAVQIKQTNNALQANSRQAALDAELNFLDHLVDDPDLMRFNREGPTTREDRGRLYALFTGILRSREFLWRQYKFGVIDEGTMTSYEAGSMNFFRGSVFAEFWNTQKEVFDPGFVEYFDALLEQVNSPP